MIIKSQDDWWELFDAIRPQINECCVNAGVSHLILELDEASRSRDGMETARLLNKCWESAPDHPIIHTWPRWGDLCDLCSECWVFAEEDA